MLKKLKVFFYAPLTAVQWAGRVVRSGDSLAIAKVAGAIVGTLILMAIAALFIWLTGVAVIFAVNHLFGAGLEPSFDNSMSVIILLWAGRWLLGKETKVSVEESLRGSK